MQKLQNRAVRVITRSPYDASANPLLDSLHLDNLSLRRKKIKAKIMFKILKGDAPAYLQNLFSARGTGYDLRNSEIKLTLPKPRTNYLKQSLCYSGALHRQKLATLSQRYVSGDTKYEIFKQIKILYFR